jgi:ribosomal protein L9
MPGPNGIITVKGSFELLDLCNKEFHKMAQNFGMIANYGEPKGKASSATAVITKQLKENPAEPEAKKPRVQPSQLKEAIGEEGKTSAT